MERRAERESQPDTVQNHQQLVLTAQRPHPEVVRLRARWNALHDLSAVVDVRSHHSTHDIRLWQELNVKLRLT